MEKRAILAAVLSIVILIGWQFLFVRPPEREAEIEGQGSQEGVAEVERTRPQAETPQGRPAPPREEGGIAASPWPGPLAKGGEDITIDTGVARIVLTTRGAAIKQVHLIHYVDDAGEPVKLVVAQNGEALPLLPLQFRSAHPFAQMANEGLYQASRKRLTLSPEAPQGEISMILQENGEDFLRKTLSFQYGSYATDVRLEWGGAAIPEGLSILWGPGIGGEASGGQGGFFGGGGDYYSTVGPVTLLGGAEGARRVEDDSEEPQALRHRGDITWTSLHSKYFMAALIPRDSAVGALVEKTHDGTTAVGLEFPGDKGEASFSLYAGPKEYSHLKTYGASLDRAVDFGFFGFLAKPLLLGLNFIFRLTSNYGWSIIILTVFIKLVFAPLTHKSTKSMQQMAKLQPKMKSLREIYKNDKQRLNEEVMKLYREHKVNPLGGCLPLLLQIPVFFALYRVLLSSIELRQAPFLWINDLSAAEATTIPVFVLAMGASMWLQQKMSPTSMDPTQAKMMMFMPILFTFLFWSFPVGLVIYWLANNLLSIGQQYMTNKMTSSPAVSAKAPSKPAKRAK